MRRRSTRRRIGGVLGAAVSAGWLLGLFGNCFGGQCVFEMTANGAWSWCSDPRCFARGTTVYAGWVTSEGDVQLGAVDVASGRTVIVDLAPHYEPDDHDNPVIFETSDGRWTALYSKHAGAQGTQYRVTIAPLAIGRWLEQRPVGTNTAGTGGATYVHAFAAPGLADQMFLFWRGGDWKPNYSIGTYDAGAWRWRWTDARTLVTNPGQRPYAKYWNDGSGRIGIAFTDGHPGQTDNNVYYAAITREDDGYAFFRADGTRIGGLADGPLRPGQADTVFNRAAAPEVTGDNSWVWDVGFDVAGRPVVTFATFPSREHHQYHWARYEDGGWNDVILVENAGGSVADTTIGSHHQVYYSGGITLDHRDPETVYLCRENEVGGWDIQQWTRVGRDDWSVVAITYDSPEKNMRPAVPVGLPPFVDAVVWMSGFYEYWENLGYEAWWPVDGSGASYNTGIKLWVDAPPAGADPAGLTTEVPLHLSSHPNPFRDGTVLSYEVPVSSDVTLQIVSVGGRTVRTLVHRVAQLPGPHRVVWDGRDARGRRAGAGVYFCRLQVGHASASRKVVFLD